MRPVFSEYLISIDDRQSGGRNRKATVTARCILVGDNNLRNIKNWGLHPQDTKALMLMFPQVEHRIARADVKIGVFVERTPSRYMHLRSPVLDFLLRNRLVLQLGDAAVRQNSRCMMEATFAIGVM